MSFGQATTSRKVDYGPAVQELLKLGFPNIEGAQYVNIVDQNLKWNCDAFWFDEVNAMDKLTGNGFYIPNKDSSKPGRFIFFGGCELSYVKKGNRVPENTDYQSLTRGDMKKADLKKDLALVQKWATNASSAKNFKFYGTANFAVTLGYANLVYQMGYKKEANELFKTLFLNHEDPEKIIDYLINALAEREYGAVYAAFNKSTDWNAFYLELIRLQAKYPRGWKNQPGLELLIPQVKNRVDKVAVPSPTIKGYTFSPEIQKLVDATANPPKSRSNYYGNESLFLINKVRKNTKASPFSQLTQYEMDGFIALVSLIGDKTLVVQSNNNRGYISRSSYYYDNDDRISPENAYNSLNKPSTRGAIAEALVRATMPQDHNTLGQMESEQFKRFAIDWWKKHRNDSKIELTKHYLQEGNQSHVQSLAYALMKEDTEESRELLEQSILTSKRPSYLSETVKRYVKKRREKAKDFISKYHEVLTAEIGDGKEDGPYQIRQLGGTEKFIASLKRYTAGLKPSQMLTKLSRSDAKVDELMEMLIVAYQGKDVSKDLNKFIYAAAKKKNASDQFKILSGLVEIMYQEPEAAARGALQGAAIGAAVGGIIQGKAGTEIDRDKLMALLEAEGVDGFTIEEPVKKVEKKAAKPREISFSKYEREDWEKLLLSDKLVRGQHIATFAGMVLDKFANPSRDREEYMDCHVLGLARLKDVVKARSRALLEGKKVEPLPSVDLVPEDRQKQVLKIFKEAKPSVLRKTMLDLSLSEQMVVINGENYRTKLREAAQIISGFAPSHPGYEVKGIEKLQAHLNPLIGLKQGPEAYDQCANILLAQIDEFAGLSLNLNSYSQLPGSDIGIYNMGIVTGEKQKKAIEDVLAGKLDGFVSLASYNNQGEVEASLIYSKGKSPSKEELQKLAAGSQIGFIVSTKDSIEKKRKEKSATAGERKKLIEDLIKLSPALEEHRERFEDLTVEQLKQSLKQYKQMLEE